MDVATDQELLAGLPHVGAERRADLDRLARALPDAATLRKLGDALRNELRSLQGSAASPESAASAPADSLLLRVQSVRPADEEPDPFLGQVRVRLFVALGDAEAIMDLALDGARAVSGRVVGVPVEKLAASDLLTAMEEGILSFFFDRLARAAGDAAPEFLPLVCHFVGCENAEPEWGSRGASCWWSVRGSVTLAGTAVFFRLLAPIAAFEAIERRAVEAGRAAPRLESMANTLAGVPFDFVGRLAELSLTPSELANLQASDILLLDPLPIQVEADGITGRLFVAPRGERPDGLGFEGDLFFEDGRQQFRIEQVTRLRAADAPVPLEGKEDGMTTDGASEGQTLLPEIPITLRVELGRVSMTLAQLSDLGPGSVLELHRGAESPVSLLVADRVVGQGHLVSLDNGLGVRISNLG